MDALSAEALDTLSSTGTLVADVTGRLRLADLVEVTPLNYAGERR